MCNWLFHSGVSRMHVSFIPASSVGMKFQSRKVCWHVAEFGFNAVTIRYTLAFRKILFLPKRLIRHFKFKISKLCGTNCWKKRFR